MYSKVLLSLFAVACALPTDLVPTPQCLYNGHIYPPGTFQPSVCVHCQCSSTGQVTCAPQFCPPPICVDAVKDPSKCCPVCPNGRNCRISGDGTVVKFGENYFDGSQECHCPSHGSFEAECIYV
uniref:VWFC domain-containing protein n=1 Tax=Magallana gigas TaxID=29159 RepID=A0A8W8KE85_MAGGI|nr:von Willebrand factor C domain-containing protein 2-like [Crassostrea gigas]